MFFFNQNETSKFKQSALTLLPSQNHLLVAHAPSWHGNGGVDKSTPGSSFWFSRFADRQVEGLMVWDSLPQTNTHTDAWVRMLCSCAEMPVGAEWNMSSRNVPCTAAAQLQTEKQWKAQLLWLGRKSVGINSRLLTAMRDLSLSLLLFTYVSWLMSMTKL